MLEIYVTVQDGRFQDRPFLTLGPALVRGEPNRKGSIDNIVEDDKPWEDQGGW